MDVVSTERVLHLMFVPDKLRQDVIRAAQPQMAEGDGSHPPRCFKKRGSFGDQICYLDLVEIIGDTKFEKLTSYSHDCSNLRLTDFNTYATNLEVK